VTWFIALHRIHRQFLPAIQQNTSLVELPGLNTDDFYYSVFSEDHFKVPVIMVINNILDRNRAMYRADLLLALQPRAGMPIRSRSGIWYMAFGKLAKGIGGAYIGVSAIFKILQARPAILEKNNCDDRLLLQFLVSIRK
jgi:hypothetical protein